METVKDLDHLKELANNRTFECKILLNFGCFSRKEIAYYPNMENGVMWSIYNHIDETQYMFEYDEDFIEYYPLFKAALERGAIVYEPEMCYN